MTWVTDKAHVYHLAGLDTSIIMKTDRIRRDMTLAIPVCLTLDVASGSSIGEIVKELMAVAPDLSGVK